MKKLTGLLLVAGLILMFSSCKKDWTCECTVTYQDNSPSGSVSYIITNETKGDATDDCDNHKIENPVYTYACELK